MIALTKISNSSMIAAHGYDPVHQVLAVEYHGGSVFHYKGVEPDIAAALAVAESPGKFLNSRVRGMYDHERIVTDPVDAPLEQTAGA
ncbi:MAG TPA: KTSC domain-containing protein [Burkholderiaceae bacterium]|nr:KTSC domain-containing protein [Burkholderiaceae bacterium]